MKIIYQLNINFGCSILLKYYYIFEQLIIQNIFNKIYVSIDYNQLKYYRTGDYDYYNNYIIFLQYINNYDNIIIENEYNPNYKNISVDELSTLFNIPIKFKIYKKLINNIHLKLETKYITISTKFIGINYSLYLNFKEILFNILNKIKYPIILLGERNISPCLEYEIHETFSIYNDLILNLHNFIDYTIIDNTFNNELQSLLFTCDIFNKSELNIFISNGGVSELVAYTSYNILGLTSNNNVLDIRNYEENKFNNINIYNDFNHFISYLSNFCSSQK
jgi:hypothetical protein